MSRMVGKAAAPKHETQALAAKLAMFSVYLCMEVGPDTELTVVGLGATGNEGMFDGN